MKKSFLKLSVIAIFTLIASSCSKEEPNTPSIEYPISLTFKKEGISKLEYWKNGVLSEKPASEYLDYFKDKQDCLNSFKEETDKFCKSSKIIFTSDTQLNLSYNERSFELNYEFINDTLKINVNGEKKALAIGSKDKLIIYGNLYRYKTVTEMSSSEVCGGDEFLKFNFDGSFFISDGVHHKLPIESPEKMGNEDEYVFLNKEYILSTKN